MDSRPFDAIVAGHVCLDVIPRISGPVGFEPGTLVEVGAAAMSPGGAVSNVGTSLSRLGVKTLMIGKTGEDPFGRTVRELLDRNAPNAAKSIKSDLADYTSYTIVLSVPDKDRMFLHSPGANRTFRSADVTDEELQSARLIHFGYPPLMESIFLNDGQELVDLFSRAKQVGLITSLDMSFPDRNSRSGRIDWRRFLQNVLPHVDYFMPSIQEILFMVDEEFLHLTEADFADIGRMRWAAGQCVDLGCENVVLKLGSEGLYFRGYRSEYWQSCFPVKVVGTTGSGDATIAGFICGLLEGRDIETSLSLGTAVGALCCEGPDAVSGVPERAEVDRRWKQWSG